jgi:hypothetical protein
VTATRARLLPVKVVHDDVVPPAAVRRLVIAVKGVEVSIESGTDVDYVAALVARLRSEC